MRANFDFSAHPDGEFARRVAIIPKWVSAGNDTTEDVLSNEDSPQASSWAIGDIAADNISGAAEILLRGAEIYALLNAEQRKRQCASAEHAIRRVVRASVALLEAQPGMAPLARLASAAVESAAQCSRASDVLDRAQTAAQTFAQHAVVANRAAAEHASVLIREGSRVLTHSRSSTVLQAFRFALAAGRHITAIVTESRPMMEGRTLASELVRDGASVTLIADADAAGGVQRADLVLMGADAIGASTVTNKLGTSLIALAARELGKPVYLVCDTSKFIGSTEGLPAARTRRDRSELWPDAPDRIDVLTAYFEETPLSFFTSVICEQGSATPAEVSRMVERFRLSERLLKAIARSAASR